MHAVKYDASELAIVDNQRKIMSSKDAEKVFREIWDTPTISKYESAYAIYLDINRNIIDCGVLNIGMRSCIGINLRTAVENALTNNAYHIVVAHNHPSGNAKPSDEDLTGTSDWLAILSKLEINLLDHIIITTGEYYSFRDNNLLN